MPGGTCGTWTLEIEVDIYKDSLDEYMIMAW